MLDKYMAYLLVVSGIFVLRNGLLAQYYTKAQGVPATLDTEAGKRWRQNRRIVRTWFVCDVIILGVVLIWAVSSQLGFIITVVMMSLVLAVEMCRHRQYYFGTGLTAKAEVRQQPAPGGAEK